MAVVTRTIRGIDALIRRLTKAGESLPRLMKKIIDKNTILLITHLRRNYFTGGTSATRLARRTGRLAASTRQVKAKATSQYVRGGITFGTAYAGVHIGPRGQVTTIKPKRVKYLTIPLPAVKTAAGVTRGGARSELFANTFVKRSRAGNLIIFGAKVKQRGANQGQAGAITPLFLLKKSVKVKARVHPEDFMRWVRTRIIADVRREAKI